MHSTKILVSRISNRYIRIKEIYTYKYTFTSFNIMIHYLLHLKFFTFMISKCYTFYCETQCISNALCSTLSNYIKIFSIITLSKITFNFFQNMECSFFPILLIIVSWLIIWRTWNWGMVTRTCFNSHKRWSTYF